MVVVTGGAQDLLHLHGIQALHMWSFSKPVISEQADAPAMSAFILRANGFAREDQLPIVVVPCMLQQGIQRISNQHDQAQAMHIEPWSPNVW